MIPTIDVWSPVLFPDKVSQLSLISFPVVQLNVATLLFVELAGQTTSQELPEY